MAQIRDYILNWGIWLLALSSTYNWDGQYGQVAAWSTQVRCISRVSVTLLTLPMLRLLSSKQSIRTQIPLKNI